jgi:beta-lactam-binding protein with PASTA domain
LQPSDTVAEGVVIASDPAAAETLTKGRTVTLVVSSGPRQVRVPSVIGDNRDAAQAELEAAGLGVDVQEQESAKPIGEVLSQSPGGGDSTDEGSTVTIVVSSGPATVAVPGLVGLTQEQALAELHDAGLAISVVEVPTTDQFNDGHVIRQSPSGGTRLRKGATVTVEVGVFEEPTTPTTPTSP